jgi:hypothetical protein
MGGVFSTGSGVAAAASVAAGASVAADGASVAAEGASAAGAGALPPHAATANMITSKMLANANDIFFIIHYSLFTQLDNRIDFLRGQFFLLKQASF